MKNTKHILNTEDRVTVQTLCAMMMEMNSREDRNADQGSTYGHLYKAIVEFVKNQTGFDISTARDWNLGGNCNFADDIQVVLDTMHDETLEKVYIYNCTTDEEFDAKTVTFSEEMDSIHREAFFIARKSAKDLGREASVAVRSAKTHEAIVFITVAIDEVAEKLA